MPNKAKLRINCASLSGLAAQKHFLHWKDAEQIRIVIYGYDYQKNRNDIISLKITPQDLCENDLSKIRQNLKWENLDGDEV